MPTDRQSAAVRPDLTQRGRTNSNRVTAPDVIRTAMKLAASMRPSPRASRQSSEFAAKAIMAISVSSTVYQRAVRGESSEVPDGSRPLVRGVSLDPLYANSVPPGEACRVRILAVPVSAGQGFLPRGHGQPQP